MSNINHPNHYGGDTTYEVIKVLRAWGLFDNALRFNVVKYLARAGKKGDIIEDLEKAKVYLQWEIDELKAEREQRPKKFVTQQELDELMRNPIFIPLEAYPPSWHVLPGEVGILNSTKILLQPES